MASERPTRVLILGAGFGGLELSTRLSDVLGPAVQVTLIDRSDSFVFGFAKLDVMFGRRTAGDVRLPYRSIRRPNVQFRQEAVLAIDPEAKRVRTDAASHEADVLVVALGADLAPEATPGLVDAGQEFYSTQGAAQAAALLQRFEGGEIVIGVLGGFFKCPPAPYETAFMLHDQLTRRGLRAATSIHVVTPMSKPIPVSDAVSAAIIEHLDDRKILYSHGTWTSGLDPGERLVHLKNGDALPFDLFLGVPVHVAPPVVVESGLTEDGWIPVDPATLATRFPGVYAIGDVTSAPVPRAGVIAEGEAAAVAGVLIHELAGGPPPEPFAGQIKCYIEMGDDTVGQVDVNFLSGPEPTSFFQPPSAEGRAAKREFGQARRQRWFGLP